MAYYRQLGTVPPKRHTQHRDHSPEGGGRLYHEELMGEEGFSSDSSLLYHVGVPSALVARNESWVRQQAQALVRHLPANVEKADLIQVGLIAVAQASLSFVWEGDPDTEPAREAVPAASSKGTR